MDALNFKLQKEEYKLDYTHSTSEATSVSISPMKRILKKGKTFSCRCSIFNAEKEGSSQEETNRILQLRRMYGSDFMLRKNALLSIKCRRVWKKTTYYTAAKSCFGKK
jgi:hypothetical protein